MGRALHAACPGSLKMQGRTPRAAGPYALGINMYDLKQLRAFVELARRMHFGQTAEALHVSQPTLSNQIRHLEEIVGAPLIHRSNRTFSLTPFGRAFLPGAKRILSTIEITQKNMELVLAGEAAELRVGVCPSAASSGLFTQILKASSERFPLVQIRSTMGSPVKLTERLLQGELDVIVHVTYGLQRPPHTVSWQIAQWQPCLAAPAEADLTDEFGRLDPSKVEQLAFIAYEEENFEGAPNLLETVLGVHPHCVIKIPSVQLIRCCVEAGIGAAILPSVETNRFAGRAYALDAPPMPVHAMRMAHANAPTILRFFDMLQTLYPSAAQQSRLPPSD